MNSFIFCPICSDVKLEVEQVENGDIYLKCPYQPDVWYLVGDCGVKAHWIVDTAFGNDVMSDGNMVICSECGQGTTCGKTNYCSNCGARMMEE